MPSNAEIYQTSFLNGLSAATAQEGGKLAAMQQAAQLQYGLQSKQLDFQLSLLKMRESQAAQAVELRMAQDEHQLRLKDYALRAEESQMRRDQLSMEMETKKVATAAGVAISGLENRLVQAGVDPSSPEFLLTQVSAVRQGALNGVDERVLNMVGSTLNAKLRTTQEALFNDGLAAFDKLNASRQVSREDPITGETMTERMFGAADKGKLIAVADRFRQAALLGHEPSQRMYGEVMALVEGVGATAKPGVTPAAGEAEQMRAGFIEPKAPGQMEKLRYPGAPDRAIEEARKDWRSDDVALAGQYIEGARARLLELQKQARVSRSEDDVAAIAQASAALSELEAAAKDETGLPGWLVNSRVGQAMSLGGGAVYREEKPYGWDAPGTEFRVVSPTLRQLENLQLAKSPQALLNEIDAIHRQVRSKRPRGTFNDGPFVRY